VVVPQAALQVRLESRPATANALRIFRRKFDGYWGPRIEDARRKCLARHVLKDVPVVLVGQADSARSTFYEATRGYPEQDVHLTLYDLRFFADCWPYGFAALHDTLVDG